MRISTNTSLASLLIIILSLSACTTMYYSTWEKLGKHKRDLLRDNVEAAKEEQKEAREQFKTVLERIKALQNFDGGKLEKVYNALKEDYDDAVDQSEDIKSRIEKVENISTDLFEEWQKETDIITNQKMKSDSRKKLAITQKKYSELHRSLKKTETRMDSVLVRFNDHVLYLKHNLNAVAIGGLETETINIEKEINKLISDMQTSISEADKFIKTLPP